mgnify:CR=1 FL=1
MGERITTTQRGDRVVLRDRGRGIAVRRVPRALVLAAPRRACGGTGWLAFGGASACARSAELRRMAAGNLGERTLVEFVTSEHHVVPRRARTRDHALPRRTAGRLGREQRSSRAWTRRVVLVPVSLGVVGIVACAARRPRTQLPESSLRHSRRGAWRCRGDQRDDGAAHPSSTSCAFAAHGCLAVVERSAPGRFVRRARGSRQAAWRSSAWSVAIVFLLATLPAGRRSRSRSPTPASATVSRAGAVSTPRRSGRVRSEDFGAFVVLFRQRRDARIAPAPAGSRATARSRVAASPASPSAIQRLCAMEQP